MLFFQYVSRLEHVDHCQLSANSQCTCMTAAELCLPGEAGLNAADVLLIVYSHDTMPQLSCEASFTAL